MKMISPEMRLITHSKNKPLITAYSLLRTTYQLLEFIAGRALFDVLQVFVCFCENGTRAGRAVHFTNVPLANHCVEDRGGTAVADAEMTLEQRCRAAFRLHDTTQS